MRYVVQPYIKRAQIQPEVYGNFSEHLGRCIYEGLYVGEDSAIPNVNGMRTDVVEALRNIQLPVLRWPGGCFADEYHWKEGIGPKADRKRIVNTNWGYVVEDNSFGTHEFLELCRQVGCKPYINGNVGSGTVQEMAEWIEYMTAGGDSTMAKLRGKNGHAEPWQIDYFGVGNENWGCGGNMRPEYYADLYRRYQSYVKQYGEKKIFKIACGPGTNVSDPNYNWTEVLMRTPARTWTASPCTTTPRPPTTGTTRARRHGLHPRRLLGDACGKALLHGDAARRPWRRSWISYDPDRRVALWSTSGARGSTSSPAPTRASSISRTPCATPWSRA